MFINDKKIDAGVAVTVKNGDVVCFGVNIAMNVFKFSLDGNVLKRIVCQESDSQEPNPRQAKNHDQSQKYSTRDKNQVQTQRQSTNIKNQSQNDSAGVKKQDQSRKVSISIKNQSKPKAGKRKSSECGGAITNKKLRLSEDPTASSTKHTDLRPGSHIKSPSVSPSVSGSASLKPSPALSIKSTPEMNMDVLFEGCKEETEDTLNEAIFGSTDSKTKSRSLSALSTKLDATTIQIQMAKKAMECEKHKLMSSIAALKSELAAKDQLLAKREDVEKKEKENERVISSMQEEFTCVICQELFVNAYTLPCAHSFCEWCIKEWTKTKKQKDCPICRKKITSDPVHSLVLDNAIEKIVSKMSSKEQKDRKEEEQKHQKGLNGLAPPAKASKATAPTSAPTTTRYSVGGAHIIIHDHSTRDHPIEIEDDDGVMYSTSDCSTSEDSGTSSDSSDDGYRNAYYGGYGRCFNCGKTYDTHTHTKHTLILTRTHLHSHTHTHTKHTHTHTHTHTLALTHTHM